MNLADDPTIDPAVHDLARSLAHEHIIGALAFMFACNQAEIAGVTAAEMTQRMRDGILSALSDGGREMPAEFKALLRAHVAKPLDAAVGMARTNDEMRKAGRF